MFLVSPNDKCFYSYEGTSVGPSQMKILCTSYYQNICFWNTVLFTKISSKFLSLLFLVKILQSESRWRKEIQRLIYCRCVDNVFFSCGFYILLQCLSMIHKTGTNLRNEVIWRLLLLEQMPTFGDLDDKNTGANHWKRNKLTWYLLQQGIDLR